MRCSLPCSSKRQSSTFSATSLKMAKLVPVPSYVAPSGYAVPGQTWVILGVPPAVASPLKGDWYVSPAIIAEEAGGATVVRCPREGARTPHFGVSPDAVPACPVCRAHVPAGRDDAPRAGPRGASCASPARGAGGPAPGGHGGPTR